MNEQNTAQAKDLSLQEFLSILRRRKAITMQTFVVVVVAGIVITMMTTTMYRSSARILVEGKEISLAQFNANDPLSNLFVPPSGHGVDTQIEVLQSPAVVADAYKAAGVPPRSVRLEVKQIGDTDVIEISATSHIRAYAEQFAQAIPDVYLHYVTGNRKSEVSGALKFAGDRLQEEHTKLLQAELAMERFKQQSGVVNTETERTQDIAALAAAQADLQKAVAEVGSGWAKLNSLIRARQRLNPFVVTPTTVTNNVQIGALKDQIAALQGQRARLLFLYKPNDDEVRKVDLQIEDLEHRLAQIPSTVTTTSRTSNASIGTDDDKITDAQAALHAEEANLAIVRARAADLGSRIGKYSSIERTQADLQREVERGQNVVTMLSKSVEDLSLREKATHDPVLTIAPASQPIKVAPKTLSNLLLAVILGLLLGCSLAVLQDFLDDRLNDSEEAKRLLGVPILGHLPLITGNQGRLLGMGRTNSHLLESFRILRSNVQFTFVNGPVHTLLVTSTVPAEGKSSTASNLAVALAMDARRIILVDGDLHKPRVNVNFDLDRQPGLTDVLAGTALLEQTLRDTDVPGLRVLTAGSSPPNPAELLNSPAMDELLQALKTYSDMVIIDSPPCLATADAQVLSAKVDGVLYVMHLGEVQKSAVRHAFELLHQSRARVIGLALNKVERSSDRDSYYAYGYYNEDDDGHKSNGSIKGESQDKAASTEQKTVRRSRGRRVAAEVRENPAVPVESDSMTNRTDNSQN